MSGEKQTPDVDKLTWHLMEITHALRDIYALGAAIHLLNPAHASVALGTTRSEDYDVMAQRTELAEVYDALNKTKMELLNTKDELRETQALLEVERGRA